MRSAEVCAGYNGLGMAVEAVFGSTTAWFSEFDDAPSKILAHHYPGVPNHGDMTLIDWAAIEQVDILAGGTPCQDLSHAGRRKGMTEGTRSNLWVHMREAIAIQRPEWVVWENVRGAYSACASSEMGQCPGCLDKRQPHRPFLRALGRVLGDLSDLGYDCQWRGLRAADVGACHGRFRVFVLARLRDVGVPRYANVADVEGCRAAGWGDADPKQGAGADRSASDGHRTAPTENPDIAIGGEWRLAASGQTQAGRPRADTSGRSGTSAPDAGSATLGQHPGEPFAEEAGTLRCDGSCDSCGERHAGHGWEATADAPSARRPEGQDRGAGSSDASSGPWSSELERASGERADANWGEYEPAIRRWERVLGRAAPRPTEPTGRNGGHRLSPRFTEWMMGLPDGWVTDPAIGISRNEQLKACGNGVVPQQAIAALRDMLAAFNKLEVAA